jgi:hypothetical protein
VPTEPVHLIGLLLGTEDDWPTAFEELVRRAAPAPVVDGVTHRFATERVTIEPFDLRSRPRQQLVLDRLGYWHTHPREWLKKVALMDDVYLLNNPFTFQCMEKHAAYCAMLRLGLHVPDTWLLPFKEPLDNPRYAPTAARYQRFFDLDAIADSIGYPLFMKPFDGGAWVGVQRVGDPGTLHKAYDGSGQRLMHLQAAVDGYDVFARSLSIGAETLVLRYRPDEPQHARYHVEHDFLDPATGAEVVTISRVVNAYFCWEWNSCETLVRDGRVHPIDYANATPDAGLTSLHYYFPWVISALARWCVFCCATGRSARLDQDQRRYFAIADRDDLDYGAKLAAYGAIADGYFERERYEEFRARHLGQVDEAMVAYVESADFDRLLVATVRGTFPPHEHERFVAHYRGLLALWASDQHAARGPQGP